MTFNLTSDPKYSVPDLTRVYIFCSVWPPFEKKKKLLARLIICSLCTLTICNFNYFPFEGWIWVLIACIHTVAKQYTNANEHITCLRYFGKTKSFMYFSININIPRLCQGSQNKFHFKRTYIHLVRTMSE